MTEPKSPWDRDEVTQPSTITAEEQVLGSEANRMDAETHPLRNKKTPPYGTRIPPEIHRAVQRAKQDTATGGVATLSLAEIAANERTLRNLGQPSDTSTIQEPTAPSPIPDAAIVRKGRK